LKIHLYFVEEMFGQVAAPWKVPIGSRSSTGFRFELVSELPQATPAQKCRRTASLSRSI
jgi:hypothetical protein